MRTVQTIITKLGATVTVIEPDQGRPFIKYAPNRIGTDTFTYKITQDGQSDTAEVTVEVKEDGTVVVKAKDDRYELTEGQTVSMSVLSDDDFEPTLPLELDFYSTSGTAQAGVSARAAQSRATVKTITTPDLRATMELVQPSNGDLPYFIYRANLVGQETVQYVLKQQGQSSVGTITIVVKEEEVTLLAKDDSFVLNQLENAVLNIFDKDIYNGFYSLGVSFPGLQAIKDDGPPPFTSDTITNYRTSLGNKLTLSSDSNGFSHRVTYEAVNEGTELIEYTLEQRGKQSTAKINITVNPVLLAKDDTYELAQGQVHKLEVIKEDFFDEKKPLTLEFFNQPDKPEGKLGSTQVIYTSKLGAKMTLVPGQRDELAYFTYEPYNLGEESVQYRISQDGKASIGTINITVRPVKDLVLEAEPDEYTLQPKQQTKVSILANDKITAGVPLLLSFPDLKLQGRRTLDKNTVQTIYETPNGHLFVIGQDRFGLITDNSFIDAVGKEGTEELKYELQQNDKVASAGITLTVKKEIKLAAEDVSYEPKQGDRITMNALSGDTYLRDEPLEVDFHNFNGKTEFSEDASNEIKTISTPTLGNSMSMFVPKNGSEPFFTYQAKNQGKESVQYQIGQGEQTAVGTITINVQAAPLAIKQDTFTLNSGEKRQLSILANDVFERDEELSVTFRDNLKGSRRIVGGGINIYETINFNSYEVTQLTGQLPTVVFTAEAFGDDAIQYQLSQFGQTVDGMDIVTVRRTAITFANAIETDKRPVGISANGKELMAYANDQSKQVVVRSGITNSDGLTKKTGPQLTVTPPSSNQKPYTVTLNRPHQVALQSKSLGYLTDRLSNTVFIFTNQLSNATATMVDLDVAQTVIFDRPGFESEKAMELSKRTGISLTEDNIKLSDTVGRFPDDGEIGIGIGIGDNPPVFDLQTNEPGKDFPLPIAAIANEGSGFVVVNNKLGRILVFFGTSIAATYGSGIGSGEAQFSNAEGIAIDSEGTIYVADTGNNRIQKFTEGQLEISWGGKGSGRGQFNAPSDIAVGTIDRQTYVFVTDAGNNRVQVFNQSGTHLLSYGAAGTSPGEFNNPRGIEYLEQEQKLLVSDTDNNRIQVLDVDVDLLTGSGGTVRNQGYIKFHKSSGA